MVYVTIAKDKKKVKNKFLKKCNVNAPEVVNDSKLPLVVIGQGEGETKWNGCDWYTFRFILYLILRL
jgi:hypothetical protein